MQFIPSTPEFEADISAVNFWEKLSAQIGGYDGICYYKHPIISSNSDLPPHFALIGKSIKPLVITIFDQSLTTIQDVSDQTWLSAGHEIESPLLNIDDWIDGLNSKFSKDRRLRNKIEVQGLLVLPQIEKRNFEEKYKMDVPDRINVLWKETLLENLIEENTPLNEELWTLQKSIFQGVDVLNRKPTGPPADTASMGGAIHELSHQLALLDDEQHQVATQLPNGPQRIRGLAGTGKTVILAMKAANIHRHHPDANILFTFNTQSLYQQIQNLVTKFYRAYADTDPDWSKLRIMHGWGSKKRPGVYYEACKRSVVAPLNLDTARRINSTNPFSACCNELLRAKIEEHYDFVLVDEAQDFPQPFFELLGRITQDKNKKIYFAYDELQTLTSVNVPSPEDLFGRDSTGKPVVSLDDTPYPGGIEKDFILHRSYRCPLDILLVAHGIGLGIHATNGCIQMLDTQTSWEAIGYEYISGSFKKNEDVKLRRPPQNSPNKISEIYTGTKSFVQVSEHTTLDDELDHVAEGIYEDITKENVAPEHILVICLDNREVKTTLPKLQNRLHAQGIQSTIPGIINESWEFTEKDSVTLASVFRAKGNEASVVYIISFDQLSSYSRGVQSRNAAFTALSRAKGWLRISGIKPGIVQIKTEVEKILGDSPDLEFVFPDMDVVARKLSPTEQTKRHRNFQNAESGLRNLIKAEPDAISEAVSKLSPEQRALLLSKLNPSNES